MSRNFFQYWRDFVNFGEISSFNFFATFIFAVRFYFCEISNKLSNICISRHPKQEFQDLPICNLAATCQLVPDTANVVLNRLCVYLYLLKQT
jgi:hypothetical protein